MPARDTYVFWVDLADLDFSEGKPPTKLTLTGGTIYAGNVAPQFRPAPPVTFLAAKTG